MLLLLWLSSFAAHAQDHREEIAEYREKQLKELTAGAESPLWPEDSLSISYFDVNGSYLVKAKVEFLEGEKPFKMPTYAGTTKDFIRYAKLHFEIEGVAGQLTAYKNLELPGPLAALNSMLFVPFMDETNGETTYGGGRYLDIAIPARSKEILLDFN